MRRVTSCIPHKHAQTDITGCQADTVGITCHDSRNRRSRIHSSAATSHRLPQLTLTNRLKILLRIIERDRRMRNFTDVIGYALGSRGEKIVTVLFIIEICAWV